MFVPWRSLMFIIKIHHLLIGTAVLPEGMSSDYIVDFCTAMQLDGVDDFVDCGNSAGFDITEEITLSAWVNTSDAGNDEHNPFVGKGDHAYAIKHSTGNEIQFFIYDGAWITANVSIDDSFNGDWRFVAGTFDGSQLKIYVDGTLASTLDYEGPIATNSYNVAIGSNTEAAGRFSEGIHDEVTIYNRALSEGEILYLAGF